MTEPPAHPARRWLFGAAVVFGIAAAIGVVLALDPREVWRVARSADPMWLALSVVPVVARIGLWGGKFARMVGREHPLGPVAATRAVAAATFLNLVTPTAKIAGGLYRAADLRRRTGWRYSTAHGWVVADQITNALGLLALYGVLALIPAGSHGDDATARAIRVSGVVALALVAAWIAGRGRLWQGLTSAGSGGEPRDSRWGWLRARLERLLPPRNPATVPRPDPRPWHEAWLAPALERRQGTKALLSDVALGALPTVALCVANAWTFRALGVDTPVSQVSMALVLGTIAGSVGGMGGIGLTEAALVALYARLGIDGPVAAAAALLHRTTVYLVTLAWGAGAFFLSTTPKN